MKNTTNYLGIVLFSFTTLVSCSKESASIDWDKFPTGNNHISSLAEFQNPARTYSISEGVYYEQHKIDTLFGKRQLIHITLYKPSVSSLKMEITEPSSTSKFGKTSAIASAADAKFAINGSFFNGDGNPSFWLKINDKVVNATGGPDTERGEGVFYIDNNNMPHISYRPTSFTAINAAAKFGFGCGPMLLVDGEEQPNGDPSWNGATRARTAIGIRPNGEIIFAVVDETLAPDATAIAAGITVQQMAKLLKRLGCTNAINFDGGGSSTMYIKDLGVVSYPSDGSSDNSMQSNRERLVTNTLILK